MGENPVSPTGCQAAGAADGDIDAKEAWNTIRSAEEAVVVVIDIGVDHYEPGVLSRGLMGNDSVIIFMGVNSKQC